MSKIFNIATILLVIILLLAPTLVNASDVNMNLTNTFPANSAQITSQDNSQTSTNTLNSGSTNLSAGDMARTSTSETYTSGSSTISSLSSLPESDLGLTNILCIILIVIGVLLILLAIAIIIRLKS